MKRIDKNKWRHTSELSEEAVTDQPQQGSDVQLEFLFSQVDPQLIQDSGERCVHIPNHLHTKRIWVRITHWGLQLSQSLTRPESIELAMLPRYITCMLDVSNLWEDLVERLQDKFHKAALRVTAGSFLCELATEQKKEKMAVNIRMF